MSLSGQNSTIRARFGSALDRLSVDCYSIFCQDAWQRFSYIPHEIDPHIFYPEVVAAGPTYDRFNVIFQDPNLKDVESAPPTTVDLEPDSRLRARWYPNCAPLDHSNDPRRLVHNSRFAPLFGTFVHRERIKSAVVFVPQQPLTGSDFFHPELLFFNFRSLQAFDAEHRNKLTILASTILRAVRRDYETRTRTWSKVLRRTVSVQSDLVLNIVRDAIPGAFIRASLGSQHALTFREGVNVVTTTEVLGDNIKPIPERGTTDRTFYESLLQSLLAGLGLEPAACDTPSSPSPQPDVSTMASLFLLKENAETLRLENEAQLPRDAQMNPQQTIFDGVTKFAPSITNLTVLTRQTHLLPYVDGPRTVSIELDERGMALLQAEVLPPGIELVPIPGRPLGRLAIGLDNPVAALAWLERKSIFGRTFPILIDSLRARMAIAPSNVYLPLRSGWTPPCSELCVPIMLCGQSIGCVNIESTRWYRWTPSVLNVMTFLAGLVGIAIVNRMKSKLLMAINRFLASQYSTHGLPSHLEGSLSEFAQTVRDALWCKQVEFLVPVRNPDSAAKAFARLVSSAAVPAGSEHSVRVTGWTSIAAQQEDALGVVLYLATPLRKGSPEQAGGILIPPTEAWFLRRSADGGVNCERIAAADLSKLPPMNLSSRDHVDCAWFIAIRLPVDDPHRSFTRTKGQGVSSRSSVVWIHHRECGSCEFGSGSALDLSRLASYCSHAISICEACAVVPAVWEARVSGWEQTHAFLRHGGLSEPMGTLAIALDRFAERTREVSSSEEIETVTETADLARYLQHKVEMFSNVAALGSPQALREQALLSAAEDHPVELHDLVSECWRVAKQLTHLSPEIEKHIVFVNDISAGVTVQVRRDFLREILVQGFRNARMYPVGLNHVTHVKASVLVDHPAKFTITIADDGPGIELVAQQAPSVFDILEKIESGHGIGGLVMTMLANALGGSAQYGAPPGGGSHLYISVST